MKKHTPGPWNIDTAHIGTFIKFEGLILAKMRELEGIDHEANAKRIVECVNLLEGIENPTEYIEGCKIVSTEFFAVSKENEKLRSQLGNADILQTALNRDEASKLFTKHNKLDGFIQWKGTAVCMDFHCECGQHNHYDAEFCYVIKCSNCGNMYAPSSNVEMIRVMRDEFPIESNHSIKTNDN